MRVLLIEPDLSTAESAKSYLKSEDFNVDTTNRGEEGIDLGKRYDYDIILLELVLPDVKGYEVLRTLRQCKVQTPVMIVSGLASAQDKVRSLGYGADDYMTKPVNRDELVARIRAIVRRAKGHDQSVITVGDIAVNIDTKTMKIGGQRVYLTAKEYKVMELLSLRKGRTITKEMFLNYIYDGMDEPDTDSICAFIYRLRKKISAMTAGNYIEVVRSHGYALREPERVGEVV